MKIAKILALMVCISMLISFPRAEAAFLSVSPTGSFDATSATTITYDVFFNTQAGDASLTYVSWDFDMVYDTGELGSPVASNVLAAPFAAVSESPTGTLNDIFFSITPPTSDVTFSTSSSTRLASITFNILTPAKAYDGNADFWVLSNVGVQGFTNGLGTTLQFARLDGADVGYPVPIPGALWLLGSGLIGMVGIRRKLSM